MPQSFNIRCNIYCSFFKNLKILKYFNRAKKIIENVSDSFITNTSLLRVQNIVSFGPDVGTMNNATVIPRMMTKTVNVKRK